MIARYKRQLQKWFEHAKKAWLKKRVPKDNCIQLNINNTFILPSSFGWASLGIVVCLFILGTNFQNNIILLLCYFLLAMVLLAVFHSYFFFVQHKINFLPIQADYENRQLYLSIQVDSKQDYQGGNIQFKVNKNQIVCSPESSQTAVKLPLPRYKRGRHKCPPVTMRATYGFGLFTCWANLSPRLSFYVYPSVQKSKIHLFNANADADLTHASDSQVAISDDLQGIREYQQSDPIYHVSWKHSAKGQGMLTKDFTENKGVSGWLRLADLQSQGTEQALRCLCYQIQELDKDQVQFGLDLGDTKILPNEGPKHLQECLVRLAMHKRAEDTNSASYEGGINE